MAASSASSAGLTRDSLQQQADALAHVAQTDGVNGPSGSMGDVLDHHRDITAAVFRDLIGASRKFAIAVLDWCDRTGVTVRVGDLRKLRRS